MWNKIKDLFVRVFKASTEKAMVEYLISTGKYNITDKEIK